MIKQQMHRDRPCSATQFYQGGDVWSCRLSADSGQQLPKRERYVLQVRVSDLKIPTTDLPFPSYFRHTSPWQCDTWLRTPRSPISMSPLDVNDSRYRVLDLFNGAKELPRFLIFNLTYHFITRCFGPLDIQLPLVRMRDKNCATVRVLGSWEM